MNTNDVSRCTQNSNYDNSHFTSGSQLLVFGVHKIECHTFGYFCTTISQVLVTQNKMPLACLLIDIGLCKGQSLFYNSRHVSSFT